MPLTKLPDEAGDTLGVCEIDGFHYPYPSLPVPNFEQEMKSMNTWKARDDDLLLCTYPKSGTHWIWEIMYLLVNNKEETTEADKGYTMMENLHQERFDALESPRLLNSHLYPKHLPRDIFDRKCKLVLVFRNPKDVAVSFYNHHCKFTEYYRYNGSWKNYLPRFLQGNVDYGSYFDYAKVWEEFMKENPDYPIHKMYYEDMMKDGHKEVTKLSMFLGLNKDAFSIAQINKVCGFDNMKKKIGLNDVYRKGKVGDWKNWFTVAQNELFDKWINEKAKRLKLKMKFEI